MHAQMLKIPPPLVALGFVFISFGLSNYLPRIEFHLQGVLSFILIFVGLLIGLLALRSFNKYGTTFDPLHPDKATRLVTDGLFGFSRNPMYLGLLTALAGVAIYTGIFSGLIVLPGFILYITHFQIKPEEEAMAMLFGKEFLQYSKSVRRWI